MEDERTDILTRFSDGSSVNKIAKDLGVNRATVKRVLFSEGVWEPKSKVVKDGKVVCRLCGELKPLAEFRDAFLSDFRCNRCIVKKNRHRQLKTFGLTEQDYADLLVSQDGMCAICGSKEGHRTSNGRYIAKLAVDHDHRSGHVRGLLCGNCNRGLGHFKDSEELLLAAIAYLKKPAGG